jgi:hypothetical protein
MKVYAAVTSPVVTLVRAAMWALSRAILALTVGIALLPLDSEAVTSCKVHISSQTGLIDVFASGVSGPLLWGARSGAESLTFANAATCIAGSSASKCEFGAPGSVQAITPPDLCTVYMKDSGPECAVYIKGCTPGPRFTDQAKADALQQLVAALSFHHSAPTIEFSGVNVQVDSGSGATNGPVNGTGNLIIGYNRSGMCSILGSPCSSATDCLANTCSGGSCFITGGPCTTDGDCPAQQCNVSTTQTGSHNLVINDLHTYTSFGGLVAGFQNSITGMGASVTGGSSNTASGTLASVSGGSFNTASGGSSTVSGGGQNTASDGNDSVSGGGVNTASGGYSTVSGGYGNTVNGFGAAVSGGNRNDATEQYASVSGGQCNTAGPGPALAGPNQSSCGPAPTSGAAATVSGGYANVASGDAASVSGGVSNTASGLNSSVSGGGSNAASSTVASVSGGAFVAAGSLSFEWHAGQSAGFPTGTEY